MGFPPLGNFPKLVEVKPDFPESLQCVSVKCLVPNPEKRFENAGQVQFETQELFGCTDYLNQGAKCCCRKGEETLRYGRLKLYAPG